MLNMLPNIYILGYGNLGQHLLKLFLSRGINVSAVFSNQNINLSVRVFDKSQINSILKPNDLVFVTTKDDDLKNSIQAIIVNGVIKVICSGGLALSDFNEEETGVWYPLYSFSKDVEVNWHNIPIFVECYNPAVASALSQLNEKLNIENRFLNSQQRGNLHVAAVFANNFVNACLIASSEVLDVQNSEVIFADLLPIIEQTIDKVKIKRAIENQTGPAKRNDQITLQKHILSLKNHPDELMLYENISTYIQQKFKNNL